MTERIYILYIVMGKASIKCGLVTTIYDVNIDDATSMTLENTAGTGIMTFKTGSIDGDTAVVVRNSGDVVTAAFHGSGQCLFNGPVFSKTIHVTVDADGLGGNTYNAVQLLGGLVTRTGSASFVDKMPSAALIVDAIGSVQENTAFYCTFRNKTSNAVDTITLQDSDDGTFTLEDSNKGIAQNKSATWLMIVVSPTTTKTISGYLVGSATLT